MNTSLSRYFRCPDNYSRLAQKGVLSETKGYFRFGPDVVCYGKLSGAPLSSSPANILHDALCEAVVENGTIHLPFDLSEVLDNLRCELYTEGWRDGRAKSALARMYYLIRPFLSIGLRSWLKKLYLSGWGERPFPRWPVDSSVDSLLGQLLLLSVRSSPARRVPFIWFWPEGASSCCMMTHDVETEFGQKFSPKLMDIDDSFGIKGSFQIIPEERYSVSPSFLASVRDRGFEIVIHDLNHDGHLYRDKEQFLRRAAKINAYGKQYGAEGFRAAVLYRKQLWYDALDFSYDMSIPNVAHLDPQRGGCCTVMPFFIGNMVELPVTTTQDYMLFHILDDYSIDLWERQIDLIMRKRGLISFIVHPDYVAKPRERATYEALLAHLARLRQEEGLWIATPGEVNRWWRERAQMRIVEDGEGIRIEGDGSERARIAYATEEDGQLALTIPAAKEEAQSSVSSSLNHVSTVAAERLASPLSEAVP